MSTPDYPSSPVANTPGIEAKKFFSSLLDTRFTSFITPRVIRVIYILALIGASLEALGIAFTGFRVNAALGIFMLVIVAPLFWLFAVLVARVYLEIIRVIFTIADDLHAIRGTAENNQGNLPVN